MSTDLEQLKTVIGEPLSYKKLCDRTGLPVKRGNAKIKQLKELDVYCKLVVTQNPTRYTVIEVYPEAIQAFETLNGNDKFQIMFEAVMYQALLNNHNEPLYLSNLDLLKLFCEVNENFAYACNKFNMIAMGDEYFYMSDMGMTVYRILKGWTLDRLDRMHQRHIINVSRGYRAYKTYTNEYGTYEAGIDAPRGSEFARRCAKVCRNAEDEWYARTGMMRPDEKEYWCERHRIKYSKRMPKSYYEAIKDFRRQEAKEEFCNEGIVNVRPINIIDSPGDDWLKEKLFDIYSKYPALESINGEACRKVLNTQQLDALDLTLEQKVKFIEVNMQPNPVISFKEELKRKKEEGEENEFDTQ